MKNFNYYGFITFYGILFLIILNKVIYVPVTCDELPTVSFYSRFSFWEIMMYPDNIPNNHILNTLLTKCCILLFGKEQWAIRLPNLLSFPVFTLGVFRILKQAVRPDHLFFLPAAILFVNPYLLDFFGVCRGYGISVALTVLSTSFLISGFSLKRNRHIWLSLLFSILASYANFTLLVFWVTISIMVWIYFIMQANTHLKKTIKPTVFIVLISLVYIALIIVPLHKMQSTDEFQYWTSKGFYKETIESLIYYWRYNSKILSKIDNEFWVGLIVLVVFINIIFLLKKGLKEKKISSCISHPAFVVFLILFLTITINITQTKIMGTPNLNGRTALFFFPLVSVAFATALGLIPLSAKKVPFKILAIVLGIICLINLTSRITLKSVKEWSFDQNNLEVINFLKEKSQGKPISLKTSWFFHPSFTYYIETGKAPWLDLQAYDKDTDINTAAEYYYIFGEDYEYLKPRFEVVYKFAPDRWLLKQKTR